MMNKRGLSTVITSMIIILLCLVAVGVVWIVVQDIVTESTGKISLGQFSIELEMQSVKINIDDTNPLQSYDSLDVMVKRNPGKGELVGIKFLVTDVNENSQVFTEMGSIEELGFQNFNLVMTSFNASVVENILMVPILESGEGKEIDEFEGSNIDKSAVGL